MIRRRDPVAGPLIIKRDLDDGPADVSRSRLHNEQRILERLQGVAGCPRLLRFDPVHRELMLEDIGGVALDQSGLLGEIDLDRFLALSEALARILAEIHACGVVHKDINPANILIRLDDDRPQIIDFDLSTSFAEEHPAFDYPNRVAGTPAYLSPEQTGRMNRPVDYRADLYSLGATLYALATGAPPFDETDGLGLIHAHLARAPIPPRERAPWLPFRVSELILTLLAKEPDDRYQSAAGLAHDLQQLRQALTARQPLDAVGLRERDLPLSPRPPRRLYGRDRELATLMAAFARVTKGGAQGLFVAGYAGVGKTSLIQEIHQPVTLSRGLFISGKFEQFQRDRPFLAPAQSLRHLCQLLLAEPETVVEHWRERILNGVGPDAEALFEVIPELQALLGPQAPAPELGPRETQTRLRALLVALIHQVAAPEHPLVLFLDDLQWADPSSLEFIGALLDEPRLNGFLLIGAYRDNEVDAEHPLLQLTRQPTASGQPAQLMTLASLTLDDLAALLAEMLRLPSVAVQPLATALCAKTRGNPFFTLELLMMLYREGALRPDPERGVWHWDDDAIAAYPVSANVVDLLAARLAELATPDAEALVAAACLGNAFTLGLLARATGATPGELADRLTPALEQGILVTPSTLALLRADPGVALRFCHDRMQQAAYQLRDASWRKHLHLTMGRRFAESGAAHALRAAEHYAVAVPLLGATAERAIAGSLFFHAALQARQACAFATAEHFLHLAIGQLAPDAWRTDPDAAFSFHAELHLVLYSLFRNDEADEVYRELEEHAESPLQLVDSACVQIANLSNRARYREAVTLGCGLLERLDMPVPMDDLNQSLRGLLADSRDIFRPHGLADQGAAASAWAASALGQELAAFHRHVSAGALERLPAGGDLTDTRLMGVAKLINSMGHAANSIHPTLLAWMQLRVGRLWIEEGYCKAAIYPLVAVGTVIMELQGDLATAERLARIALTVGAEREGSRETARGWFVYTHYIGHWRHPLEEDITHAHRAFAELVRAGDLEFAAITFVTSQPAILETCAHLNEMNREIATALAFVRKTGNWRVEQGYLIYRQLTRALQGQTKAPGSFTDAEFDEQAHQAVLQSNPIALCYFHLYRALAGCVFNDEAALAQHAESAVALMTFIRGFYPAALANLLHSLALIQRIRATDAEARPALLERLTINQHWLKARAADAPMNFGHLYDLVEAERLDALDQPWAAIQTFEQAMRKANGHQRPWHQALITERAGDCFLRRGLDDAGRSLLTRAHGLYRQWGADGKARAMRASLPLTDTRRPESSSGSRGDALDHAALLSASLALASETSQPRLVARVVELVSRLTGATDVRLLLMDEESQWHLEGGLRGSETLARMTLCEAEERRIVAAAVPRLGLKTRTPLVSDDAVLDSRFTHDPYFAALSLCSLLALPVLVRDRISAFLILENRLYRAAFTTARVETATMLCAQLAISIENIALYQLLERKVAERTRALEAANFKLEALSATDGLTGIANRRGFDAVFSTEWLRAMRSRRPLALAMIDVDWFKKYNDHYGHQGGDDCLRAVAQAIRAQARRGSDFAARYGGEEFAIIAPETDAESMRCIAETMRAALESLALPHAGSPLGQVTVSIGVAAGVPEADALPEDLLRLADDALYRAKTQGRNRVVLAIGDPHGPQPVSNGRALDEPPRR